MSFLVRRLGGLRGKDVAGQVAEFIPPKSRILDLGCGLGFVAAELEKLGHQVVGIDLKDVRAVKSFGFLRASAYDLPFADDSFDICLAHTALHHMDHPDRAIREARRVARLLIIGEEIRTRGFNWWLLRNYDRAVNLSFSGHPHSNRTHEEWSASFRENNLKIDQLVESRVFGFIHQVVYVLSRDDQNWK
ncbi:methyltransferase domain-containing protein [Rhodobacter sp. HX-7-19]|uniref:Methyltransferase domain-containing protein n=1 Tax=Paragemmobacter kunshanensis TaxID=2583234 RepID=A0A6M1U1C0_9RHOB|nr:methyltransferase domain-containing protein [Rhodobacter kunshanensis]